jgi:AcrR family transcriptional regulator
MVISERDVGLRAGRPRDPACDAAILQAALDAFTEHGYAGVSMEGVAARAGVGKATVYRRYSSKAELVVEAVRCGARMTDVLPDSGDLRADLRAMMRPLLERLRGEDGKLLTTFAMERFRNPDLADEFDRAVIGKKRDHIRHLIVAAVERGELRAGADVDLLAETPAALVWHFALYGLPLDDTLLDRIVELVLPSANQGG